MLTYAETPELVRDDRPGYRPFSVRVARTERMTPHFTRITFTGDDLEHFGRDLHDQRIKLILPFPDRGMSDFGQTAPDAGLQWYARWRELPDADRNPLRTYTIRAVRPELQEIDVDFVDHGAIGPAGRWLQDVAIGDELVICGPEARSIHSAGGIDWHPGPARTVLLAGDETAAPAICSILEQLPEGVEARAFIEVPSAADVVAPARNADRITWLGRDGAAHGTLLEPAVRAFVGGHIDLVLDRHSAQRVELEDVDIDAELIWDAPLSPGGGFYAWLAGEASVIKSLRRFLVTETGVDRKQVAFMGYWRAGRAELND